MSLCGKRSLVIPARAGAASNALTTNPRSSASQAASPAPQPASSSLNPRRVFNASISAT